MASGRAQGYTKLTLTRAGDARMVSTMPTLLKPISIWVLVGVVTLAVSSTIAGQGQAPPEGQGRGRAAGPPPPPPEPQAGHPAGKLVIWGDVVSFDVPGTLPTHCIQMSRFKRGQRIGFRMTAIDGGTGETENTAVLVAHLKYAGQTIDVPMRWRGQGGFPAAEYPRQPSEMWTGVWVVPADAQPAALSYTVTATDRFGRTATFSPFINVVSQIAIVE
ncbi:MAG TPA: hypothetical protein VMS40_12950 [Vicinamibacterales bacterium]|nr:hypothetical protein [Vicinamibacterales bacterium]